MRIIRTIVGYYLSTLVGGCSIILFSSFSNQNDSSIVEIIPFIPLFLVGMIFAGLIFLPLTVFAAWALLRLRLRRWYWFALAGAFVAPSSMFGFNVLGQGLHGLTGINGEGIATMVIAGAIAGSTYWYIVVARSRETPIVPVEYR